MARRVAKATTEEQRPQPATGLRAYRESVVDWAEKRLKPYIQRIEAEPSPGIGRCVHSSLPRARNDAD